MREALLASARFEPYSSMISERRERAGSMHFACSIPTFKWPFFPPVLIVHQTNSLMICEHFSVDQRVRYVSDKTPVSPENGVDSDG